MGYHVLNIIKNKLEYVYVKTYRELSKVNFITNDSIIYQGEEHWKPERVSESINYKNLGKPWFRAGIQAEDLFKKQASENGFILEELKQDQESFKSYTLNAKYTPIKRGDFLVRNYGNIEIDVKCRSFRENHFDFNCDHLQRHVNMQAYTGTPIVVAVYENKGNCPVADTVYMFLISDLFSKKGDFKIHKKCSDNEEYECYRIPIEFTTKGFDLIKDVFSELKKRKKGTYSVAEKQKENHSAYNPWTAQEEANLKLLLQQGESIKIISQELKRSIGAVLSRIKNLGIERKG